MMECTVWDGMNEDEGNDIRRTHRARRLSNALMSIQHNEN